MDLYSILAGSNEGSLNSQTSEAPQHRKRPRMDNTMMPGMIANPMANSPIDSNYADENYSHQVIFRPPFYQKFYIFLTVLFIPVRRIILRSKTSKFLVKND